MAFSVRRMLPGDIDRVASLTAATFVAEAERDFTREFLRHAYTDGRLLRTELGFVVTVSGEVVAHVQLLDFGIRIGCARLRGAGMFGALAEPNARGAGLPELVRQVLLEDAVELGFDVCIGFAKQGAIYARAGAVPVALTSSLSIDAIYVPLPRSRRLVEMQPRDEARVLDMHARGNSTRVGSIIRTAAQWPLMPRRSAMFLVADDGYVGLRVRRDSIEIREIAGFSPAFFDDAIRTLAELARARQKRYVTGPVPLDHPIVEAARPYGGEVSAIAPRNAGCMARVLAPSRTLAKLAPELETRWTSATPSELTLSVRSGGVASNVALGGAGGEGGDRRAVSVDLSESQLTSLVFGYRSAAGLFAARDDAPDAATLTTLDTLFPPRHAFIWDADRW